MSKYTDKKWVMRKWSETSGGEQPEMAGDCFVSSAWADICYLATNKTDGVDETESDARLIAQAPAMHKELEKILTGLIDYPEIQKILDKVEGEA